MAPANSSPNTLNDDLLADVAYWRARGASWEDTAAKVKWEPAELRRITRSDPDFERELAYATREYEQEAEARALHSLRLQMDSTDPRAVLSAAKAVLNYLTRKRVERTRLEVARSRAEAQAARSAKTARAETPGQESPAEEVARAGAPVHLWGGCHKLTGAAPDHTDTPLRLVRSEPAPGRVIYWALLDSLPTPDPDKGPFLKVPTSPNTSTSDTDAPPG